VKALLLRLIAEKGESEDAAWMSQAVQQRAANQAYLDAYLAYLD
jgi:hypothetical protein